MSIIVVNCGPYANESERVALDCLKQGLEQLLDGGSWMLLTNVLFSVNNRYQSDEVDIVAIGPTGVRLIEVKHWSRKWIDQNAGRVEDAADLLMAKAKRVGTTLRKLVPNLPRVDGVILVTQSKARVRNLSGRKYRGVSVCTLAEWQNALGVKARRALSPDQVEVVAKRLIPRGKTSPVGVPREINGYINLVSKPFDGSPFHQVFESIHSTRRDAVELHLYDLTVSDNAGEDVARREFEVLQRLQIYRWAPRIMDSFQEVSGYVNELYFFTILNSFAPCIKERSTDNKWRTEARHQYILHTLSAIGEFHGDEWESGAPVHRGLCPENMLVLHDNRPLLGGFDLTKIPSDVTISGDIELAPSIREWAAPEVQVSGIAAADQRSDVYSACKCLQLALEDKFDETSEALRSVLQSGLQHEPKNRARIDKIIEEAKGCVGDCKESILPSVESRFWSTEQVIEFNGHHYQLVGRLGSGGTGATYKVVQIDRVSGEQFGTYVAKVVNSDKEGREIRNAYARARPYLTTHSGLTTILEVADGWKANSFLALLNWVDGVSLREFVGQVPRLATEEGSHAGEQLLLRWLHTACESLVHLHSNGLVHGDISPGNIIVGSDGPVITDFDLVTRVDLPMRSVGTVVYSPTAPHRERPACTSDDIFSLAATFFHVAFDQLPFERSHVHNSEDGLVWDGIDRSEYSRLSKFLDKATHPNREYRFRDAADAIAALHCLLNDELDEPPLGEPIVLESVEPHYTENEVTWLKWLLQSYPGSRWGNRETRGLDSRFAHSTYVVQEEIEGDLVHGIEGGDVQLVILCGNAGDGKTAMLQHMATSLGIGSFDSSDRIFEGVTKSGRSVLINLDGSAAHGERSADELLDQFFAPFADGTPSNDRIQLLAINDGRLHEWIDNRSDTPLSIQLRNAIAGKSVDESLKLRFIDLNQRSLVGNVEEGGDAFEASFITNLIDNLYGCQEDLSPWKPCRTCSARKQCGVVQAARAFAPDGMFEFGEHERASLEVQRRSRERLIEAFQAVHMRGETHITVREMRSALIFILFGVHYCTDYHSGAEALPFWDRAFLASNQRRQGELLRELARLDPGMESHPAVDQRLVWELEYTDLFRARERVSMMESARRRFFFEWTEEDLSNHAKDTHALSLAQCQHLHVFRKVALQQESDDAINQVKAQVCGGIAGIEELPEVAFSELAIPLRVSPRTPTETAFWIQQPLSRFRLFPKHAGMRSTRVPLHRRVALSIELEQGRVETLELGAELFHHLLTLSEGYQLGDASTDDTFANLAIFVQRIVHESDWSQEAAPKMFAWNPMTESLVYELSIETIKQELSVPANRTKQVIRVRALNGGDDV